MFEKTTTSEFKNRAHLGKYVNTVFDTYIMDKGKEEVETIESSIHYAEAGRGEPLILLHNVGTSLYLFRNMIRPLAAHFHVYAIDLPGHGFSQAPYINYTIEEVSLSIEAFMNAAGIEKAHFMTFGESAAYALDFAEHNRARTGRMIFISPHIVENDVKGSVFFPMAAWSGRLLFTRSSFEAEMTELYFDRTMLSREVLGEYFDQFKSKEFKSVIKLYQNFYNDSEVKANIFSINRPMLVIYGGDDTINPPLEEGLGGYPIRSMRTYTVRNCGYMIPEEKPERIVEAAVEFITAEEL